MTQYLHTVTLPSRARIYDPALNIPEEFTLRAMTTQEEKILYGSTSEKALDAVIKACIVEPKDINLDHLILPDKHFLMMQLRIHTYGSDYHVSYKCPYCGHADEYKIDLEELTVHELPEDFQEPIKFKLPVSGDELAIRLLRGTDLDAIERKAKRFKRNLSNVTGDITYIFRMVRYIQAINGEELNEGQIQGYVEKMHARDAAYFWHQINKIQVGYDTTVTVDCTGCGEELEFTLPITAEFFRPKFDD